MKLKNKVALITGGNSGIGLATAKRFAAEGAKVFITGRRQAELDAAVKQIEGDVTAVQGDVSNLADLDRLYETIGNKAGRIDVLFANAGGGEFGRLGEISEEHFDKTFGINVKGVLFTVQKALPLLAEGASIIINGSIASIKGMENFGVYSATKAAVRSFARTWTSELKSRGIRVNVISPGPIETPAVDGLAAAANIDPSQLKAGLVAGVPLGRIGNPGEIAAVAAFLASDESSYIAGVELFVDGGLAQV